MQCAPSASPEQPHALWLRTELWSLHDPKERFRASLMCLCTPAVEHRGSFLASAPLASPGLRLACPAFSQACSGWPRLATGLCSRIQHERACAYTLRMRIESRHGCECTSQAQGVRGLHRCKP